MQAKLTLLLNNIPFESIDINIPEYKGERFEDRVEMREDYVRRKIKELRLMYVRQILKVGGEGYALTIPSRWTGEVLGEIE